MVSEVGNVGWIVVGVTESNGRRWYESSRRGVASTRDAVRARVWASRDDAERWSAMVQRMADQGRGGIRFHVEARSLEDGHVKVLDGGAESDDSERNEP